MNLLTMILVIFSFFFQMHTLTVVCFLPDHELSCQQRLPFVCEKHNVTSVEISPLDPKPDGQPCGNNSLSFRNKV